MLRACVCLAVAVAVVSLAGSATAGIPDPNFSYVDVGPDGGMTTCPSGDGPALQYVTVTALRSDMTPIQGIPSSSLRGPESTSDKGVVTMAVAGRPPTASGPTGLKVALGVFAGVSVISLGLAIWLYTERADLIQRAEAADKNVRNAEQEEAVVYAGPPNRDLRAIGLPGAQVLADEGGGGVGQAP